MVARLDEPKSPGPKFGFTITRKVGNAVVRNRLRRRFREITREAGAEITAPAFIVTIPRFGATKAEFAVLRSEWRWAARKLGLLPSRSHPPTQESPPP